MKKAFALWITGAPGSGKSALARALVPLLHQRDVDAVVLESDAFRKSFMPHPTPSEEDRSRFYRGMIDIAALFLERGVPVILDATGNRRCYREPARKRLAPFAEVLVDCPQELRLERQHGNPGTAYEPPLHPEVTIHTDREDPESGARKILDFLVAAGWVPSRKSYRI